MVALRGRLLLILVSMIAPWLLNAAVGQSAAARPLPTTIAQAGTLVQINEVESNDTPAQANLLIGTGVKITGNIFPYTDVDVFSINARAGDRLFAATMTSFSASGFDSILEVLAPDGTTVLESDNDDGSLSTTASSIAGVTLPTAGVYFVRVKYAGTPTTNGSTLRPYALYIQLESGAPVAETEPNNIATPQALPASRYVTGTLGVLGDNDTYSLVLNAGDTVFASLDLDPERDGATWNGRIGLGSFENLVLVVDDASSTSPNSEASFLTVKEAGTYYVYVDQAAGTVGGPSITYHLSVGVLPVVQRSGCTTYSSTNAAQALGPGASSTTSTINVPDDVIIEHISTTLVLTHSLMADLDVTLTGPDGNQVGLFTDIGNTTAGGTSGISMNTTLDDEASYPAGIFKVLAGTIVQPERDYRLAWFKGQQGQGSWTLTLYDDTANTSGGMLQSWSVTLCGQPASTAACASGSTQTTLFSSDFEDSDGGFTHSGTSDVWQWGAPSAAPITHSFSGANSWETNLSGDYPASASMDLLSPAISLSGVDPADTVYAEWYQTYQMESASFDHFNVSAILNGTAPITPTLFEFLDATMRTSVGSTFITVQERAGWGRVRVALPASQAATLQLRFHVDTDSTINLAGAAIDDLRVFTCSPALTPTPTITITPTGTITATSTPITATMTPTGTITATSTATSTPTNTPMTPTNTPMTPTSTPMTPTNTPMTPTNTPMTPTNTPMTPTSTPTTTATTTPTQWQVYIPLLLK